NKGDRKYKFGNSTDIPVTGDWNGDGYTEIGIFRAGYWYLDYNGNGVWEKGVDTKIEYGIYTDTPVTGNWNDDGYTEIGVFNNRYWYIDSNGNDIWD
ncbi:MAG: fibrinogen-binding protein, partial [Candidatus Aenigmatarchaeota archaeon]